MILKGFAGLLAVTALFSGVGAVFTATDAEARTCFRRICVARVPFVCKGPIGSCGFQQGACTRWRSQVFIVTNNRSCAGSPPVVR